MSAKLAYGIGNLYEKHGAWYGRWRTSDGRRLNRRLARCAAWARPTG